MNELKLRKATEADHPMLQACINREWPEAGSEDWGKLHTIIAEGVGFISFYHGKYPFPTVCHVYIEPEHRRNGYARAFAYWIARWFTENGHNKFVIMTPNRNPYIEQYLIKIAKGLAGGKLELDHRTEEISYYVGTLEV